MSVAFVKAVSQALLCTLGAISHSHKPYPRRRPDEHIADRIIAMPAYLGGAEPIAGLKWIGGTHNKWEHLNLERARVLIMSPAQKPSTAWPEKPGVGPG